MWCHLMDSAASIDICSADINSYTKCLRKNLTAFVCLFSITCSRVISAAHVRIFFLKKQNSHSLNLIWLSTERHLSRPTSDYLNNTDMSIDYTNTYSGTHFQFHRYIPRSGAGLRILKQTRKARCAPYIPPYANYLKNIVTYSKPEAELCLS